MKALRGLLVLAVLGLSACGPAAVQVAYTDLAALDGARIEWNPGPGLAWLSREVRAVVDTAARPQDADSTWTFHGALTRYGTEGQTTQAERITLLVPAGAHAPSVRARLLSHGQMAAPIVVSARIEGAGALALDPGQRALVLTLPYIAMGDTVEVIATLDVPGTLVVDAQPFCAPEGPTKELLIRGEVPGNAVGRMATMGEGGTPAAPMTVQMDGRAMRVIRRVHIPKCSGASPYARFTTVRASPRGYKQRFATTWTQVLKPFARMFLGEVEAVRGKHQAPIAPKAGQTIAEQIAQLALWTRDRIQRTDALTGGIAKPRRLAPLLASNDFNATDKAHLLHWLLDGAGLAHHVAIARSNDFPAADPKQPSPGLFDAVLIYDAANQRWLDPACQSCAPGEIRPSLRGGQALLLPKGEGGLRPLPL